MSEGQPCALLKAEGAENFDALFITRASSFDCDGVSAYCDEVSTI